MIMIMSSIGIIFGFYGYVFPGNINLMILDLYASGRYRILMLMLALILIFESIYCIVLLMLLNNTKIGANYFSLFKSISYILIFIMGLWMLLERKGNRTNAPKGTISRGVLNMVIHPQQIPYWFIAGSILSRKLNLTQNNWAIISFSFFNAVGTLLAMIVYMFLGGKLLKYFNLNIFHINKAMGLLYLLLFLNYIFVM